MTTYKTNITRIKAVRNALGDLNDKVVFVGGATVSLYTDRMAVESRPTDDVDILVEVSSRLDFAQLEEQLRNKGFANDAEAKFLGRYRLPGLVVDVMPIDKKILGFVNKWYEEGFKTAMDYVIDEQHTVRIFTPPYFIASKLEAFKNRGGGDGRTSTDFEDIIYILENRRTIWDEIKSSDTSLLKYLQKEFDNLHNSPYVEEWISAHASYFSPPSVNLIMEDIKDFLSHT
jgi:predicted nucleotidyltransferase